MWRSVHCILLHSTANRQVGILVREVTAFKEQLRFFKWPSILAGGKVDELSISDCWHRTLTPMLSDFNFTPSDPAYSLITGDTLLPPQEELITPSMVIHSSLDPTVLTNASNDDEEDVDPDRHITNARAPVDADGLLPVPELVKWFSTLPRLRSIYNDGLHESRKLGINVPTFGMRTMLPAGRNGANEPEYTSYTHY